MRGCRHDRITYSMRGCRRDRITYSMRGCRRDRMVELDLQLPINQCLSPLMLWVRISLMARCTQYTIMW